MISPIEVAPLSTAMPFTGTRATLRPIPVFILALVLIALVAVADYLTGYGVRLALLYLVPITLATWFGGLRMGVLVAITTVLTWVASFHSIHPYSHAVYYYWEGAVMIATFLTFVLLLDRLRAALARADERFLRVLEGLHAGVYVVDDRSGRVLYANRRLTRLLNGDPRQLHANDFERRFVEGNRTAAKPSDAVDETADHPQASEVRDDANGRWYLVHTGPIPWLRGQHATLKVMTDISAQKQAQLLKRQHEETQRNATHLVTLAEIASRLAHEINQPLGAITGYHSACLRLLASGQHDAREVVGAIEKCQEQVARIAQIVNRTREFVRRRGPTPSPADLNAIIREAVQLMELDLERGEARVQFDLAPALPNVLADRVLVVQVVVNLLRNAIEAMQTAAVDSRVIKIRTAHESGVVLATIADRGAGIPPTMTDRLYTPFSTTKAQGLGLGLSICHSVIEAHGGRLWHTSNPGAGCSFHFALPLHY